MMKHRKKIIGVVLVFLIGISFFAINAMFDVEAASNKPSSCTDKEALLNYYGVSYDWNEQPIYGGLGNAGSIQSIVFTTKRGEFRLQDVSNTNAFYGDFKKDSDGFYTIDGDKGIINKNNSLLLVVSPDSYGSTVKVKLALSASDSICDSLTDYNTKKANKKKTATFNTGFIEIEVPNFTRKDEQVTQKNTNYNGICKAVRDGTDPTGKIEKKILDLFDSSAEARAQYQKIVPSCFQERSVYNYEVDDMVTIINAALNSWSLIKTSNIGSGEKDVNGDSWLFNFNNVVEAAKAENHAYYVRPNGANSGLFYNLIESKDSSGKTIYKPGKLVKGEAESFKMQCDVKAKSATDFSNLLEHKADGSYNIDANVEHYYAANQVINYATYIWNYTKGNSLPKEKKEQKVQVCTRTCKEAVEVKYGPPVASKAGLCFEYQVQVTSRVQCTSTIDAKPPTEPKICTPVPYCNSIPGYTHQAGANDKYSTCVRKCDGGKYTEKCSEKCYKQVYENNSKNTKTSVDAIEENAEKMFSKTLSWKGSHYWSGDSIYWSGNGYARYYKYFEKSRTIRDHGSYYAVSGFKKRYFGGGSFCKDPCRYKGCSQMQYLNKAEAKKDYKENVRRYGEAVAECKASASCTTKKAIFKITVDYKVDGKPQPTVEYPLTDKQEILNSSDNAENCKNPEGLTNKDEDIILNYAGCYKNCGSATQYHSRWSFPGSWLNKKTGELSFTPNKDKGWTEEKNKFCLPLNVDDVNTKWWNYYYGIYNKSHKTSFTDPGSSVKDICTNPNTVTNISKDDIKKEDWNINAYTTNFGYYGWNFDISCFYALNSSSTGAVGNVDSNKEKCNPTPTTSSGKTTSSYRIRSVDLKNLFPAAEGQSGSREPGFNWSSNATISQELGKNPSSPSAYAAAVQKLGYSAYNNSNVDYKFVMTKETIAQLRSLNNNKYTDFKGEMVSKNGMETYVSNVIRGTSSPVHFGSGTVILQESALGCNNTTGTGNSAVCDRTVHSSKEAE